MLSQELIYVKSKFSYPVGSTFDLMKKILFANGRILAAAGPLLFLTLLISESQAQDSLKTIKALRITTSPRIDGLLDDEVWKNAQPVSEFIQNQPMEGNPVSQRTEVKIVYDDYAIYVGAMMYDTAPDSILHELGTRDDDALNAEKFRFVFDPYMGLTDAYEFGVYSSGVQIDHRWSDWTYNAVWSSAVKITDKGWSMEMKIPYSAIRFPSKKEQKWTAQFTRDIRRNREFDQWCLTPGGQANPQKFWGTITGITDIKPPVRLSLTPYLSGYVEKAPEYNADGTIRYANSFSYNAGADIKYGLDERFTLDMTLLPDFGQVQSDNKVKNLGYREVTFTDYRPFFKEGTELFNKDAMFYSRRIGRTPGGFYSVENYLDSGETIEKNPAQAKLLNASKISGRGNSGLGFGLLNAVTDNTYAEIKDTAGNIRKVLTEPFTNYNAIVFDQQLKNASNVYFINTNVARKGSGYRDANVTGTGFSLQNKKNTWAVDGSTNLSQLFTRNDSLTDNYNDQLGYYYFAGIRKTSGRWQFSIGHDAMSGTFDRSDMGYQSIGNYSSFNFWTAYNFYKPTKYFLKSFNNFNSNYSYNPVTGLPTNFNLNVNLFGVTKKNWGVWCGGSTSPVSSFDYYEPRVDGKYFRTAEWYYTWAGFSTNYQKTFALDLSANTGNFYSGNIHGFPQEQGFGFEIKPRFRASDKLSFLAAFNYNFDPLNPGFANFDEMTGEPIFGGRELNTYINTLTVKYIFKNDLSLSVNGRHYWSTGAYRFYFDLLDNGMLTPNTTYTGNNNFSYNAFNIDAVFSWQFSPGSVFSLVYKNAIEQGEQVLPTSFGKNFSNTLESPQTNSISLKVLYYLDYQQLKRKKGNG